MNWQKLTQSSIADVIAWAETQSWCEAMAGCQQDAQWHSEGDVWTHTKMVIKQLVLLEEWQDLTSHEQTVLLFTALFHDVAKPLTTEVDQQTGRITSPKHAVKGEHLARDILRGLGCDLTIREEIARMVRFHGRPVFLSDKEEPIHEVVRHSWLITNRLLHLFAVADTRGRDTDSMSRPEENLHYWKLLADEVGCLEAPYSFATDHARFTFFRQQKPNLHYVPHEEFACQVTLLAGLPGSGKNYWLSQHRPDLPVVSLDEVRRELGIAPTENQGTVAQIAKQRCQELLRAAKSFAFNATNTMRLTRNRWLDLFAAYHAKIEIVYVEPPFATILKRNNDRKHKDGEHTVPEQVIHKLAARCEPPTWLECHRLLYVD